MPSKRCGVWAARGLIWCRLVRTSVSRSTAVQCAIRIVKTTARVLLSCLKRHNCRNSQKAETFLAHAPPLQGACREMTMPSKFFILSILVGCALGISSDAFAQNTIGSSSHSRSTASGSSANSSGMSATTSDKSGSGDEGKDRLSPGKPNTNPSQPGWTSGSQPDSRKD